MRLPKIAFERASSVNLKRLPILLKSTSYALRGGFLVRPFIIAMALGAAGALLSSLEEQFPAIANWIPATLFPSRQDPQVGQVILSAIATSIMTVVSIVFAMLLMTLTLASTQFSPRILISFVRDRSTQWTLGVFLGTFTYCMAALPAARAMPSPFLPVLSVTGAMLLAIVCVGWLIFFINHISHSISVNHIVDRIAGEIELVIDELMPTPRGALGYRHTMPDLPATEPHPIANTRSGYVRYVDVQRLRALARRYGVRVRVERRVGQFVPAGVPLLSVSNAARLNEEQTHALLNVFDIGPSRTLQQDVEFGIIQLADIALRAISPAVNDPSTAISCVDQLSRVMIRWIGRQPPPPCLYDPPYVPRVVMSWISFDGLMDTAFDQIRHYAATDVAVSLRLLRALADIARNTHVPEEQDSLLRRARRIVHGCAGRLPEEDMARLRERLLGVEERFQTVAA
jgi:uncharacterized membrane protein